MISLIEAIFGSKVGRLLAEFVLAAIAVTAVVLHYEHKGATEELGKLQKSSAALMVKAKADIEADTKQYQAAVSANQEKLNAALQVNDRLNDALADSVRQYDAYRSQHPSVASTAGSAVAAQSGECGSEDCGAVIERLAVRGNELAGSLGTLSADLQSCQRDRDALTGEPR